jgi:ABC-2 type transport system ATP-binding protein
MDNREVRSMPVVKTHNLTKFYEEKRAIQDLNLTIEEGEIYGFIGPNGAGKTTTIRLLLNFIFPISGTASIFGKDVVKESTQIKKLVGYLPAEVNYYGEMRIKDLLEYSSSFYERDCRDRYRDLCNLLDLNLEEKIESLSLGNKKKVGIVQALLHSPKLLILDEPTSGLDPLVQKKFFQLLSEENKRGVTVFFSSHVLSDVQKICHRVAIIKEGQILRVDDVATLRAQQFRKVTVELNSADEKLTLPQEKLQNLQKDNGTYRFLYGGDVNSLLRELSKHNIANLLVEEPSLEEVFLHYYEKGAAR